MRRTILLASLLLLVTACGITSQRFAQFSDEELYAYNRTKPFDEKVTCVNEATTGSYIRKTRCQTNEQWPHGLIDAFNSLDTLSPTSDYAVIRGRD